jgi:hypothetical protein
MHFDVIKSFICSTNAHLNCFKMLKFTLKITINAHTYFGSTKPSSGSLRCVLRQLQYWCQLKYFVIELFGCVVAYLNTKTYYTLNWINQPNAASSQVYYLARPRPTALLSPSSDGKSEGTTVVVVAPDDGHEDARHLLSCIYMTSNKLEKLLHLVGWFSWLYDDARTCKT